MNVFDRYKNITNIDVVEFFNDFNDFISDGYQSIVSYYTKGKELKGGVVNDLTDLIERVSEIKSMFEIYKEQLSKFFDFWELLDQIESISLKLDTIKNSQKWFRSNKSLFYSSEVELDYVLKQSQTLPSLASELGFENIQNDWVDIALKNQLQEEDYGAEGGNLLKISFQNNLNLQINTVIDGITGENVYGKDIDKNFQFELDSVSGYYDIKYLSPKNTINQSYEILINTVKGSVPEFPEDGIDKGLIGSNINAIQYPVLFRQLSNLFTKDDSFKEFTIVSIDREQDSIFIKVQAKTRLGDVLNQNLKVA